MIDVYIPDNNIKERKYIIGLFFDDFLGLTYSLHISKDVDRYEIIVNNKTLIINDCFFSKYPNNLEYLSQNNIFTECKFIKNNFFNLDYVVLYGDENINITNNSIYCGVDIFASSFFMLTRWEEYVVCDRDKHNRFLGKYSLAFKYGFLERPVVNEYIELLWKMLMYMDNTLQRKDMRFKLCITHDVDLPFRYDKIIDILKYSIKDFLQSKSVLVLFNTLKEALLVKAGIIKDPIDTFDELMNVSEKNNTKSYFFFMAQGATKYDNRYNMDDNKIQNIVKKIEKRNHFIGVHPTYNAYDDNKQFFGEKQELQKYIKNKIEFGREHYLRFSIPNTWQIWEENNMVWDSTLCYADMVGFRAGICYDYRVFNIITRTKLSLVERPLIVMDTTVFEYQKLDYKDGLDKIMLLKNSVKKYNGIFTILWHNHSFNTFFWKQYQDVFCEVFKQGEK